MPRLLHRFLLGLILTGAMASTSAFAQNATGNSVPTDEISAPEADTSDDQKIAEAVQNPFAHQIKLPFQNTVEFGRGKNHDGWRYTLKVQPVIPIDLNKDWTLYSRTILPFDEQQNVTGANQGQYGLGDTKQSFFLSPNQLGPGHIFYGGLGPILLIPTATNDRFGNGKWGAGPTLGLVRQQYGWTTTILTYQLWSFAGDPNQSDISDTYINPAVSYATPSGFSFGMSSDSDYSWTNRQWVVPINFQVGRGFTWDGQKMNISLGGRYFAVAPPNGPRWGIRLTVTLLFPD